MKAEQLLKVLQEKTELTTEFCNSVLRFLDQPESKLTACGKQVSEMVALLLSADQKNDALQTALLGQYSLKWLPVVAPSYPKVLRAVIKFAVSILSEREGELAVGAALFLNTVVKRYPKRGTAVFGMLWKALNRAMSLDSTMSQKKAAAIGATMTELVNSNHDLFKSVLLSLRSAFIYYGRQAKTPKAILYLRSLFRQSMLWTEFISKNLKTVKTVPLVKSAIVPFLLRIVDYLEGDLLVSEYAPMFVDARRITVDLAQAFSLHYPARRCAAKLLTAFKNATTKSKASGDSATTGTFDIRLSKADRQSMTIARTLKAKLVKSLQSEHVNVTNGLLSADTLDGQAWREAMLWPRLTQDWQKSAEFMCTNQISPLALLSRDI